MKKPHCPRNYRRTEAVLAMFAIHNRADEIIVTNAAAGDDLFRNRNFVEGKFLRLRTACRGGYCFLSVPPAITRIIK